MQRTDSLEKTLMLGKIEGGRRKGMTEDEMVGWHHRLDGQEFEWTPGAGDGQGGLACYSPWGRRELDTTERLNWTESGMRWRNHHFRGRKLSSRENKYFFQDQKGKEKENQRLPDQRFVFILWQHHTEWRAMNGIFQGGPSPELCTIESPAWKGNLIQSLRRTVMRLIPSVSTDELLATP